MYKNHLSLQAFAYHTHLASSRHIHAFAGVDHEERVAADQEDQWFMREEQWLREEQ